MIGHQHVAAKKETRSLWAFDMVPTTVATIGALFAPIVGIGGLEYWWIGAKPTIAADDAAIVATKGIPRIITPYSAQGAARVSGRVGAGTCWLRRRSSPAV